MDLQHILQSQPAHGRGRTPKRPSLSQHRSSAAAQRHSTLSSEPQQHRSTPPAPRVLPSSTSSRQSQEAWLDNAILRSTDTDLREALRRHRDDQHTVVELSDEYSDRESTPDPNEQRGRWVRHDGNLFLLAASEDGDEDEDMDEDMDEDEDEDDAFSLEFTLDSESDPEDDEDDVNMFLDLSGFAPDLSGSHRSLNTSQFTTTSTQHNSQISTSASEPIDLTGEPSSPIMHRNTNLQSSPAESSRKRNRPSPRASSSANDSKRRRTSQGPSTSQNDSSSRHIEEIDLLGSDDDNAVANALSQKEREEQDLEPVPTPSAPSKLQELQCTVCLDNPTDLTATVCGHAFCRTCLHEWLIAGEKEHPRRSNCPACRKPLKRSAKTDTIPLEIMVRPRGRVRLAARRREDKVVA